MTEYKFSDIKRGDRVVFVKAYHRLETVVNAACDKSAESDEFYISENGGWKVADIVKVLPAEPGSRINKVTAHDMDWEFAVRGYGTEDAYSPWALFEADGNIEFADDDDITSWENA